MFENIPFDDVVNGAQIGAAIVVAIALIIAALTYYSNKNKMQFDFAKDIQNDIIGFNKDLASVSDTDDHAKGLLYERLFNSLEWLGFLINENQIKNKKIRLYFKDMIIKYYDDTFLKTDYITDDQRSNKAEFPEFKKLYKHYKESRYG